MGRNKGYRENKPFMTVLYIILVLVLAACIGLLIYQSRKNNSKYQQEVEEMVRRESMEQPDSEPERREKKESAEENAEQDHTEQDAADEKEADGAAEGQDSGTEPAAAATDTPAVTEVPAATEAPAQTATPVPEATPTPTPVPVDLTKTSVLVLNGTQVTGVAAFWKGQITAAGYTAGSIYLWNYSMPAGADTVIYASSAAAAEPMKGLFANAQIQEGAVPENLPAGTPAVDVYVVIGMNDARTQ